MIIYHVTVVAIMGVKVKTTEYLMTVTLLYLLTRGILDT